jgi:A/G-specific adenine glycosylase
VLARRRIAIQKALREWFSRHQRDLPWRRTRNPYRIWVSEVMLQQTQVSTVIPYYRRFIRHYPNVKALAAADIDAVLKSWEGLGYYGRARNILDASRIVVRDFDGRIPREHDRFITLPGVGDYIAAAVMSIAFQKPHAAVDGNVKRVLARLETVSTPVNISASKPIFSKVAQELLDRESPGLFNQALMELGAVVCTPRKPACARCPLRRLCHAYRIRAVERFPTRIARPSIPTYRVAVGVVFRGGRVLITRRKLDGLLGGLWEFPGGKIRGDEDAEIACVREIREETGLRVLVQHHLTTVKHAYTHFKVVIDVFTCRNQGGKIRLAGPVDHRWVRLDELDQVPFPGANRKIIPLLLE